MKIVPSKNPDIRWSKERVLQAARQRTEGLNATNSVKVQEMLAQLIVEAGWSETDFIDALCHDVVTRNQPTDSQPRQRIASSVK